MNEDVESLYVVVVWMLVDRDGINALNNDGLLSIQFFESGEPNSFDAWRDFSRGR